MKAVADIFGEGSAIWQCGPSKEHEVGKLADQIGSKALVNRQALTNILAENFCFPDENRVVLWRFLLQLPMNKDAYNIVSHQDIHKGVKVLADCIRNHCDCPDELVQRVASFRSNSTNHYSIQN